MFSKKLSYLVLFVSLLSSCSWLRDKPKEQQSLETNELNLSCLKVMPTQLQDLFAGHYSDSAKDQSSVKAIWNCLDQSLSTFSKYTHGSNATYYTANELLEFANRYLPSDKLLSMSMVNSIFNLKTAVLGGTNQNISQTELLKLRTKLKKFGEMILPLSPYISTLLKPANEFTENKVHLAGNQLNQFINDFAILLEDSENTVTWLDLSSFISELENYLKSPKPTVLTIVGEQIQVLQYAKVLLVGGSELGIEKSKWQPIFKSISTIYSALYLTTSNKDMVGKMGIEIQSTDEEQKIATQKLTNTLINLKKDPSLYSKITIQFLADSWSKVLLLNSFLYPSNQNKLAVKAFLDSPVLRNLTANLIDELTPVISGNRSVPLITKIAGDFNKIIEQVGIEQTATINIANLRDYAAQLRPLFADENTYQIIDSSLSIFQEISIILIGKDANSLTFSDVQALVQKASDLYVAWKTEDTVDFNKAISTSLNILTRQPSAKSISINQIQALMLKSENLFATLNFTTTIDWSKLKKMIIDGAKLKSVLFSDSDQSISNNELIQLTQTWNTFKAGNPDEALERLTKYFKNNPYSSVKISELVTAVDAFLPNDKKISKLGLTPDLISSIKSILIGGRQNMLDSFEYSRLSQLGYNIYKNLKPVTESLPVDFKFGINAASFALLEAGVQGLIDSKGYVLYNSAIKQTLLSQLNSSGMRVQPQTIDKLLIGFNYRLFGGRKDKKPSTYPATLDTSKLIGFKSFLEKIKLDYQDLESAFAGMDNNHSQEKSDLLKKLTRNDTRYVLNSLHPIVSGRTSMPYFTANGKPQTDYYLLDLYYKDIIYHGLMWVFPAYEVEPDPTKPNLMPRLSMNDLVDLLDDINDAIYEFGFSFSPDAPRVSATKRMQNINLFTRTGNGDEYIDIVETVDFLTTTFGGKNLLDEVRKGLAKSCYPSNSFYQSQEAFSYACLKDKLFGPKQFVHYYQKVAPLMTEHFASLTALQRDEFRKSTLNAVKAGWTEDSVMTLSELETLVSIPYYVENIFLRLDQNLDKKLTFTEAMRGFPIFCREIKKAAGTSIQGSCEPGEDPSQVEAIYGHLLMKGTAPKSILPGDSIIQKITTAKDFLLWLFTWYHLDKNPAVRDSKPPFLYRKDLLNIISNLSATFAPPPSLAPPSANASYR